MKNDSDLNEYPSRRTFTKSIAATLISAPIAASVISCQTNTNRNAGPSPSTTTSPTVTSGALVRVDECKKPPNPQTEDHIPPFMIGEGGSFKVESAFELVDQPEPINPPIGPRKWRYKLTSTTIRYGNIESVQPLIELNRYFDSRSAFILANQPNALKFWLQRWDNATQNWKQPPPSQTSEPDILLKGKSGGSSYNSLVLEVDEQFSKKISDRKNKKTRPHKRVREFGPKDDEVRIYRWAIVDQNNQVVQTGTVDDDVPPYEGFVFLLTFHHV